MVATIMFWSRTTPLDVSIALASDGDEQCSLFFIFIRSFTSVKV